MPDKTAPPAPMFHVEHHVVSREPCPCGRGPKRQGGAGNCLDCHREIQKRYRDRQRAELLELRRIAGYLA